MNTLKARIRRAYPLPAGWHWVVYLLAAVMVLVAAVLLWDAAVQAFWLALSLAGAA